MATTQTLGLGIDILSDQNEENSFATEKQSGFPSAAAETVLNPEPHLEDLHISAPQLSSTEKAFIPDMFVSWTSRIPKLNPHYEDVKLESAAWMTK